MTTMICDICGHEWDVPEGEQIPLTCPECGGPAKEANKPGGIKVLPPGTIGG